MGKKIEIPYSTQIKKLLLFLKNFLVIPNIVPNIPQFPSSGQSKILRVLRKDSKFSVYPLVESFFRAKLPIDPFKNRPLASLLTVFTPTETV